VPANNHGPSMTKNALRFPAALLLVAACHMANAEEWRCQLQEAKADGSHGSSFDYDIVLEDALSARIEVAPTMLGVNPLDDAQAGTARAIVIQNSEDGFVLGAGSTGPSPYGRSAHGELLVLNRRTAAAVQTYVQSAEKALAATLPRMGRCIQR